MSMPDLLGRLLFPPKCVLCGRLLRQDETDLCHICRVDAPECADKHRKFPFLDSWTAVWYYEGPTRRSILRFKFGGKRHYAQCYGRLLAMKIEEDHPEGFDFLTWVPTAPLRKLTRGYDHAELIAQAVAEELGISSVRLLKKVRNNRPQSSISGQAQRRANVLGVYRTCPGAELEGKTILLIDDIITTGATAGEAARMLLTAGGSQVHCAAMALARRSKKRSR